MNSGLQKQLDTRNAGHRNLGGNNGVSRGKHGKRRMPPSQTHRMGNKNNDSY
jgi:hypothetical protein